MRQRTGWMPIVALGVVLAALGAKQAIGATPVWADQRHVGPFLVQSTFDLTPHAALLAELPKLELELRRVLALRPCSEPIQIVLLADERQHRALIAERYPDAPYRRALFVREGGRSTVFAYRHAEMAIDLRHECTHALLHADLAVLPLWLDEGLAEYFEMPPDERAFGHPHQASLRWRMRRGRVTGVESLEQNAGLEEMSLADYRASWAWVHFMLHGPKPASQALWSYLADIRRGEPPGAFSTRLKRAFGDPRRSLAEHFRSWDRIALRASSPRGGN